MTASAAPRSPSGGRTIGGVAYVPSGFAVVRTPYLPLEAWTIWSEGLEARDVCEQVAPSLDAVPEALAQALSRDRARLRARIADSFRIPAVREALFLASPDLEELLDTWLADPDVRNVDRVEMALVRYFQRMSGRPTPFGLFAGCSLIDLGEHTRIRLAPRSRYVRRSRLDMDYLCVLLEAVVGDSVVRPALRMFPNNSLYRSGGRIRYVESRQRGTGRSHHLVSVDPDEFLEAVLAGARGGATTEQLVRHLLDHNPELSAEDARAYVGELVSSQILVPEIGLPVTGPEVMGTLLAELQTLTGAESFAVALEDARTVLAECDRAGPGVETQHYRNLAKRLEARTGSLQLKRLIQVDLWKPAPDASLSTRVTSELLRGVELLLSITHAPLESPLDRFRKLFQRRYEEQEVPLAEVLDEESGIGFEPTDAIAAEGSPLIAGLPLATRPRDSRVSWRPIHGWLLRRLESATRADQRVLDLDAGELTAFASSAPIRLPDGFHVMATLIGDPGSDPGREGDVQIVLKGMLGPSGGRMLGRFCHLDEGLAQRVRHHLRQEESHRPDAVFAEVVHLPEGRIGNVLFRPILRDHEIPYLARSGVPADRQITLDDLMVSMRGNHIVLRSRRLGREVLPRLTNAHNFWDRAIGVYRFLCLMQIQDRETYPRWDWGPLELSPFLPRVRYGRLVFSLARWRLDARETESVTRGDPDRGFVAVQNMRARRGLPRFLQLVDGDNTMPVDLDNAHSVEAFRVLLRNRSSAVLEEMLPAPGQTPVIGPEGRFQHELIIPFVKDPASVPEHAKQSIALGGARHEARGLAPAPASSQEGANGHGEVRRFPPGSEWLYCKLYTGTATADQLLREVVAPLVDRFRDAGIARRWFFVRYSDPDWHLRLRFQGDPPRLMAEGVPALHDACAKSFHDGMIWSLQLDTYDREIERYGGCEGNVEAEAFFEADSDAVLAIMRQLAGDGAAELRWLLALHGIDRLLEDLEFALPDRLAIMEAQRASLLHEFQGPELSRKLGQKARIYARLIADLVAGGSGHRADPVSSHPELVPALEAGRAILAERSDAWRGSAARLRRLQALGRLVVPLEAIAGSFAHMHCNRMLRSAARAHELVMYDFLCREYKSRLARGCPAVAAQRDTVDRGA